MEEQIKKIYEKQKNGRIRMIRNVLLIYAALICVVSIFKGNPFPHQETVLFFDVKQPGWVTTDPWLLWICVVVDLIAGIFILIRDYRSQYGSVNPAAIVGAGIVATTVSTLAGMVYCKIMDRKR